MHSFKVSVSVEWPLSAGYYSKGWGYGGKQSKVSHLWWSQRDEESSRSGKELWEVSSEVRSKQKTQTETTNNRETHQQKHQEWWRWRDSVDESGEVSLRRHSDDPGVTGRFTLWGLRESVSDNRICKHKSLEAGTDSMVPGTERRLCGLSGVSEAVAHWIFLNITGFLLK